MDLGPQLVLVYGGLKIVAQHPGGAKGDRLKLCRPSKMWYSDRWGWVHDVRIRFNMFCACLIHLHHIINGKMS